MNFMATQAGFPPVGPRGQVGRFGASVIGAASPRRSRAHNGVFSVEMKLLSLGWPVGERMGTLSDVQKELGLGRRAFREAMAILEARGLLVTRPGPGGGLFVGAPTLEDVVAAMVMYLALTSRADCVAEFRQAVWRVVVAEAIGHQQSPPSHSASDQGGFAIALAGQLGNGTLKIVVQLAEMLAQVCGEPAAPADDHKLMSAIRSGDLHAAWERIDVLGQPSGLASPTLGFGPLEKGFPLCGNKSPATVAVRMAQDLREGIGTGEAEWETARRLDCDETMVRNARRILQDFDVLRCRQGIRGAEWAAPANAGSVIRVLAPFLLASGMSADENRQTACLLASNAPILAARKGAAKRNQTVELAPTTPVDFAGHMRFEGLLLDLADNPPLTIVIRAVGLANVFVDGAPPVLPRPSELREFNRRIVDALEAGDAVTAGDTALAKSRMMLAHMHDHPASLEYSC